MKRKRNHYIQAFLLIIGLVILIAIILSLDRCEDIHNTNGIFSALQSKLQSEKILIDGEYYLQKNVTCALLMGIDSTEERREVEGVINSIQADFLAVVIFNHDEKTYSILSINRETMTEVNRIGLSGQSYGKLEMQICLAHSFGNGLNQSCENTVDAVSDLLYGADIPLYGSITVEVVKEATDKVGGVTITLDKDYTDINPSYVDGATVEMNGTEAVTFLQSRLSLSSEHNTNTDRMHRQMLFIDAFLTSFDENAFTDEEYIEFLNEVSPYVCTNVTTNQFSSLLDEVKKQGYHYGGYYTPDGLSLVGSQFMEFYVDEESLKEILMEVLYDPCS